MRFGWYGWEGERIPLLPAARALAPVITTVPRHTISPNLRVSFVILLGSSLSARARRCCVWVRRDADGAAKGHSRGKQRTSNVLDGLLEHHIQQLIIPLQRPGHYARACECIEEIEGVARQSQVDRSDVPLRVCARVAIVTFSSSRQLDVDALVDELGKIDGRLLVRHRLPQPMLPFDKSSARETPSAGGLFSFHTPSSSSGERHTHTAGMGDDGKGTHDGRRADGAGGPSDEPEMPWEQDFAEMKKIKGAAAYESANKPYQHVQPDQIPTMSEQWKYAARRYSRFQGYAWAGVVGVAALAYASRWMTTSKTTSPKDEPTG